VARLCPHAAALLLVLVALAGPAAIAGPATTHAASPQRTAADIVPPTPVASPEPVVGTGDSRSDGGGPGIVGSPLAIALGVVLLGAMTAAGTLVVLRVTRSRGV
jgi:hypothetical protein